MLRLKSRVGIYDNSGAKEVEVIAPIKKSPISNVWIGNSFVGVVKRAMAGRKVQRKQIIKGLLVTAKKDLKRPDGSRIKFNQNRAIILNKATKEQLTGHKSQARWAKKSEPIGTKIKTAVSLELRQKRLKKVMATVRNVY